MPDFSKLSLQMELPKKFGLPQMNRNEWNVIFGVEICDRFLDKYKTPIFLGHKIIMNK